MHPRFFAAAGPLDDAAATGSTVPYEALRGALAATYTLMFAERVADRVVDQAVVQGVDAGYGTRLQAAAGARLLPPWLPGIGEGIVVDRAQMSGDRDFNNSAFFDYVIRPEGRFHCLIATPCVTASRRFHLVVGRPQGAPGFDAADRRVLGALMPHVARLITLENDAARVRDRAEGLASAFDCIGENVVVLSGGGLVELVNAGARRVLALRDGLAVEGGRIMAEDRAAGGRLQAAVKAVTAPERGDEMGVEEVALHVPRPSGGAPFELRVRRLPPLRGGLGRAARAMLVIEQPEPEQRIDGWSVGKLYGLTSKEMELAALLARGRDLREAAAALAMSYQTARHHLRHIFAKTDLHRQSDLVRMMLRASPKLRR